MFAFDAALRRSTDALTRFNLTLVIELRLQGNGMPPLELPKAFALLERCLSDPDPWVRTEAAFALGNAQDANALPHLTRLLDDPAPMVVMHALLALQHITGQAPQLTPKQRQVYALAVLAEQQGTLEEVAEREKGLGEVY